MTSRERVHAMFRGELKDGFCMSIGGMANDNMSAYAYAKLLRYLGMDRPLYIYDLLQNIAQLDPEVIGRLGGDFVHAQRPKYRFNQDQKLWKPGTLRDGTPCYYASEYDPKDDGKGNLIIEMDGMPYAKMPKNGLYYDIIASPLADVEDPEELRLFHPAVPMSDEDVSWTAGEIRRLYETTDKAIVLNFAGQLVEQGQRDFGFESFYYNLAAEQELMHAYFRMITDVYMSNLSRILALAGDMVDVVWFCDDMGTQKALQFGVPMYREMIRPYEKEMWDFVHAHYPHIKILFHCCGAIFDLIPHLIGTGADMLNVQISADGMDPQRLKDTYGKDVIFWGCGVDTQRLPQMKTKEEILGHVRRLVDVFSKGGRYVFSQVHNFQADTAPETICAIYDMVREIRDARER